MAIEESKALVRRYVDELANEGRFDVAAEVLADGFVYHSPLGLTLTGRQIYVDLVLRPLLAACPDWRAAIVTLVAEDDCVCDRVEVVATFDGEAVSGDAVHVWRVADGRLAESWTLMSPQLLEATSRAVVSRRQA